MLLPVSGRGALIEKSKKGAAAVKVLLVNKFHYRKGGSETYYFALAELLRSAGHTVLFFAMQDERNEPCDQGRYFVSNVEYNGQQGAAQKLKSAAKLLYSAEARDKFAALLQAERPDVVHLNLVHRQITLSILEPCQKLGIPVVFTQHDLICVCPNYTCLSPNGVCEACLGGNFTPCVRQKCVKGSAAKSLLAAAEARLYRLRGSYQKIDRYLCPSAFYQDILRRCGFTRSPILHLPNFLPRGTVYEWVLPRPGQDGLLYLGRLTPEKGIATLLRAAALCTKAPGFRLRIAGDGPQRAELEALAAELGLGERVEFLGFLTGEPLKDALRGCRAVVLPSEWYENGPYSVMEALSCGKPVIGSAAGGIPEMVREGETGFLFPPGDEAALAAAMQKLLALPENEYAALCRNAVRLAEEKFSAQTHLERLTGIYEEVIAEKKNAR